MRTPAHTQRRLERIDIRDRLRSKRRRWLAIYALLTIMDPLSRAFLTSLVVWKCRCIELRVTKLLFRIAKLFNERA